MKRILYVSAALVCVLGALSVSVTAQVKSAPVAMQADKAAERFELAVNFNYKIAKIAGTSSSFVLPGGSIDGAYKFNHRLNGLALAVELEGETASAVEPGVNLTQVSFAAGPRYYYTVNKRAGHPLELYGQALFGIDAASNSVFPKGSGVTSSANSSVIQTGGGANLRLTHKLSLRLLEADFLTTSLPNSTNDRQYDLRLSHGLVLHF